MSLPEGKVVWLGIISYLFVGKRMYFLLSSLHNLPATVPASGEWDGETAVCTCTVDFFYLYKKFEDFVIHLKKA